MKIIDYAIVQNDMLSEFVQEVKDCIDKGWQPFGEIKLKRATSDIIIYNQVIVKYEDE